MGRDKALLELGGVTLIERGMRKLALVCPEVTIVGEDRESGRFGRVIPDAMPGCGPLGGIVAALAQSATRWNLFLAVDVPFVPVAALQALLSAAAGTVAVIAEANGQPQPLCALYSHDALPMLRSELEAGRWKVMAAIKAAGEVKFVHFEEEDWFRNLNTPAEFAEAERLAGVLDL
jgi:molybdopterin-guanine dinucleotide biosynthesis protein A